MENYIVSARKYRPSTFGNVVGQQSLTTTLKNAIAHGKLAHAYLFCGPRGVGKTTCARIFAKTINCMHPTAQGEACNECESCVAFNEQRSYNIHELDAASNNSVEDIRLLIEQVRVMPQIGHYKVFIIDEVHMLSTAAFNAFLKTLEEPPAHAIFILATTEKHKILPTILSRCQIYDFNRMNVEDMVNHLKNVAEKEGISYEDAALHVIAQKADGGMRDALSIFDQVVSFTDGNVSYQKVIENLNVLDYDYYFQITESLLNHEISNVMLLFNEILKNGFEGGHFIGGLAAHFRDLLVSRDEQTLPLLEVAGSVRERYREQAKKCTPQYLYRALRLCNNCDLNYRTSRNKRLMVELTLIEIAQDTGDESSGSGRSPKRLSPLFKNTAPEGRVASSLPVSQTKAAAQEATPSVEKKEDVKPSVTSPHSQHLSTANTSRTIPENTSRPLLKKVGTTSIRIGNRPIPANGAEKNQTGPLAKESAVVLGEDPFEEKDLFFYWYQFSNQLPQEETAIAARMKNMSPKIIEDATFEVPVDNEQVKSYLLLLVPRIETFLRKNLNNKNIRMQVRVAEPTEQVRVYSRREQFMLMLQKSPSLTNLKEELGLELA